MDPVPVPESGLRLRMLISIVCLRDEYTVINNYHLKIPAQTTIPGLHNTNNL